MTKSDRHKKLRKKEKAKTQLTGVKKLARPQNVIEPVFRAKKILIREQLQSHEDGEVVQSSRNRSLQDVLHALNHHNTNTKKDAIIGLQEIIATSPQSLYANLDQILEKIGTLTSDIESSIRKDNLELAENIFAQLNEDQIKPFWKLLLTYIQCTLTNLNPGIPHSVLPFINLLLSYFPNLVSNSLQTLLPSVMGLISSPGSNTSSTTTPRSADGKSSLNLDISVKNDRIRVLQFLSTCLDLHDRQKIRPRTDESKLNQTSMQWSSQSSGIYYTSGYEGPTPNYLSAATTGISVSSDCNEDLDMNFWPSFVESCLPILNQTWLEVRPSLKDGKHDKTSKRIKLTGEEDKSRGLNNLSTSGVEVLQCIVPVMNRLVLGIAGVTDCWNSASSSSTLRQLRKNHGQDLRKYFFEWIPFSASVESQRKILTNLNLQLFHIAAQLRLIDAEIMEKFDHYVHVLIKKSLMDSTQVTMVLNILPLIRLTASGELTIKILIYALDSGYTDSVYSFLVQLLQIGKLRNQREEIMVESIDWKLITEKLVENSFGLNPVVIDILTLIGIRRLFDLKSLLFKYQDMIKVYLSNGSKTEAEDKITRLLTYTDSIGSIEALMNQTDEIEEEEEAEVVTISDSD